MVVSLYFLFAQAFTSIKNVPNFQKTLFFFLIDLIVELIYFNCLIKKKKTGNPSSCKIIPWAFTLFIEKSSLCSILYSTHMWIMRCCITYHKYATTLITVQTLGNSDNWGEPERGGNSTVNHSFKTQGMARKITVFNNFCVFENLF